MSLRGLGGLLSKGPLLLVVLAIVSPIGPHLRVEYRYTTIGGEKHVHACTLIGSRGTVTRRGHENCSLINILDGRIKH